MKKLSILMLNALVVGSSFAQTAAPVEASAPAVETPAPSKTYSNESKLTDLMYFPAANTISAATVFTATSGEQEYEYLGKELFTAKTTSSDLTQHLGYTFSPDWRAGVSVGYQLGSEVKTSYGAASNINGTSVKTKDDKGIEDPTIFVSSRLTRQETSLFNVDLTAKFSPKIGDAESATQTKEGNGYRGGSSFELLGEMGKKYNDSSWKLSLSIENFGKRESASADLATDISKTDAYTVVTFGYVYQWIINPTFGINLGGAIGGLSEMEMTNSTQQEKNVLDSGTFVSYGVNFLISASPSLLFDIGLSGMSVTGQDLKSTDTSTNTTVNVDSESSTAGVLTLAAKYEF